MLKLLCNVLHKLKLSIDEVTNIKENKYKFLIRKLRSMLRTLHPDSGGEEREFETVHELYEELLKASKLDKDEKDLNIILQSIVKHPEYLDGTENTNLVFDIDEILTGVVDIPIHRQEIFQVNIDELVLHFNSIRYCSIKETNKILFSQTVIPIQITAEEPIPNGTIEYSNVTQLNYQEYTPSGKYTTYYGVEVVSGANITVSIPGFSKTYEFKDIRENMFKSLEFSENNVLLVLTLRVNVFNP